MATIPAVTSTHGRLGCYLTAYGLDRAGDGLFYVALAWLATRAAGDLGAAAIIAAGSLPRVVILLFGGALADRWGLIQTARGTLVARMVLMVAFALAALPDKPHGVVLAVIAAAFGAVDALHTPALTGLSGVLLRGPAVVRAQGFMGSLGQVVEVAAGPLAGVMLLWRGDVVGWIGAALAVVALLALPSPTDEPDAHAPTSSVLADVLDVLRSTARDAEMRAMLGVFAAANFAATPAVVAGVPLLSVMRGWTAAQYGLIMAAFAVGGVVGGAAVGALGHRLTHPPRWSAASMLPGAAAVAAAGLAPDWHIAGAAVAVAGALFATGGGLLMGTIKARTAPERMGRVMSLVHVAVYALIPAGMLTYGTIAAALDATAAQALMAGVMAAAGIAALAYRPLRALTATEAVPGA